jgi:hypothetical protein
VELLEEILKDKLLKRESIQEITAIYSDSGDVSQGVRSLTEVEDRLTCFAGRLGESLGDMAGHLRLLMAKAEDGKDFSTIEGLVNDIEAVKQHVPGIPLDIRKYYRKHAEDLKIPTNEDVTRQPDCVMFRGLILAQHKSWLMYEIQYLVDAMFTITRLYKFVTK